MDNVVENIIAIRKRDISRANEAFSDYVIDGKCLNDKVKLDHSLYKDCGGTKMEAVALNVLHEVSPQILLERRKSSWFQERNFLIYRQKNTME